MAASRSARARKAAAQAGPLSVVTIDVGPDAQFIYRIACRECTRGEEGNQRAWWTIRRGKDNTFMAAMDRWIFHLVEAHPGQDAPCLEFLAEAEKRRAERRAR